MLSTRISDYPTITQGKTRIPGVNDAEELETLDVSLPEPSCRDPFLYLLRALAHRSNFLV